MTSSMKIRTREVTILPDDAPLFSEMATSIRIEDEAAGEFIKVTQNLPGLDIGQIAIDPHEWPALRDTIDSMIQKCTKQ